MLKLTRSPTCLAAFSACPSSAPFMTILHGRSNFGNEGGEAIVALSRGRRLRTILPRLMVKSCPSWCEISIKSPDPPRVVTSRIFFISSPIFFASNSHPSNAAASTVSFIIATCDESTTRTVNPSSSKSNLASSTTIINVSKILLMSSWRAVTFNI